MSEDEKKTFPEGDGQPRPAPTETAGRPEEAAPPQQADQSAYYQTGGAPPGWPPPGPQGYQGYPSQAAPPMGQWSPPPEKKGFFRKHPLVVVFLLIAVLIGGLFVIIAVTAGVGGGDSGLSAMSFGKKVGVVKVEGVIMDPTEVVAQIHRYRDDKSIKAVVVRVDSPGGMVAPSQEIYYELKKLAEDKHVVVSMGAVAASGGYYVACPAEEIYANPGTITGSIGVVMELVNLEGLFAWMKIKNSVIKSGDFKDIGSPYRPMTKEEKKFLQDFVDNVHAQFERAVAEGRQLPMEKVKEIANGSIYTGEQAKELGLVDELGDLWDAIDRAAELAGIEGKPNVVWPPRKQPDLFSFLNSLAPGLADPNGALVSPARVMYIMRVN